MKETPVISVVIPLYNEEQVLGRLFDEMTKLPQILGEGYRPQLILVDDGSRDGSWPALIEFSARHEWVTAVRLSRNYGQQAALTCGHCYATGEAVVDMDADLQDPPSLIPTMLAAWEDGYEVVLCRRSARQGEAWGKTTTARLFYRFINFLSDIELPNEVGDFRLISKRVNQELLKMPEKSRYLRGIIAWMGYKTKIVDYVRDHRAGGGTHYGYHKMFSLALDGIVAMSSRPLKLAYYLAALGSAPFLLYLAYAWAKWQFLGVTMVPGWSSTILAVVAFGTMILFMLGVIGEYLARTYEEIKPRPLFLVDRVARQGTVENHEPRP